ncbi:WD repeat-containing protein 55-like [Quillaja saponaria]|uniref:WD repeat-containing protein 55-like n=1 Tax=Quillaja saponaria TaxID=32244 RepID=A0AAD7VJ64_QUISA|nr:WD repeat-containing protein 55-like [Quillaja saponaria]
METKKSMDVSCFMLFETTGDSEVNCDPIKDGLGCEFVKWADYDYDHDDDDAESCSYDVCESSNIVGELNGCESCDADDESDGEKNEEEGEISDQTWYGDDHDQKPEHQETSDSVDSSPEVLNETEKNRRFWEACLAS